MGGDAPADGTATATISGTSADFKFSRLRWYPGSHYGNGALDEVRLGQTFASVTPCVPAALSSVESAVLQQFADAGLDHLSTTNFSPEIDYDQDGLSGIAEVLWSGNAADAANTGNSALTLAQKQAPPSSIQSSTGDTLQIDFLGPDPLPTGIERILKQCTTLLEPSWQKLTNSVDYTSSSIPAGNGTAIYRATFAAPTGSVYFFNNGWSKSDS